MYVMKTRTCMSEAKPQVKLKIYNGRRRTIELGDFLALKNAVIYFESLTLTRSHMK